MPAPAVLLPRPLSVGAVADRAILAYRRHFLPLYTLAFLPAALAHAANWILATVFWGERSTSVWLTVAVYLGYLLVILLLYIPIWLAGVAGTTWGVAEACLGRGFTIGTALRRGFRIAPRLFVTLVPLWIGIGGFVLVPSVLLGLVALLVLTQLLEITGAVLGIFTALLLLGPFFFLFLRTLATTPACVLEGAWFWDAYVRSWRLMGHRPADTGRYGTNAMRATWLFTCLTALGAGILALAVAPYLIAAALHGILPSGPPSGTNPLNPFGIPLAEWVLVQVLQLSLQSIVGPLFWAFVTVFYLDLRARREGVDLVMRIDGLRAARGGA